MITPSARLRPVIGALLAFAIIIFGAPWTTSQGVSAQAQEVFVSFVDASGEPVTITKNGKPVAQLGPCKTKPKTLFGIDKDIIKSGDDIISPIDVEWEANR